MRLRNQRKPSSVRASKMCEKTWVQFQIDDAYVPEPAQILMELHGKDALFGKIIDVSDAESQDRAFAVVEVDGLSRPIVVAMKDLKEIVDERMHELREDLRQPNSGGETESPK